MMLSIKTISATVLAIMATQVVAGPLPQSLTPACTYKCNNSCYNRSYIRDRMMRACGVLGTTASEEPPFPKVFSNAAGLTFTGAGPYYEYPIRASLNNADTSVTNDRVIFNVGASGTGCSVVGVITHNQDGDASCIGT